MLNSHPEIDIVSVITPSGLHFDQALKLIEVYKKNVLIEKPIVMRVSREYLKKAAKKIIYIFSLHINIVLIIVFKELKELNLKN